MYMMAGTEVQALLTGRFDLNSLPDVPSRVIRVYVASAVTDTIQERSVLVERVYPRLREYCRNKYGLEFQALDLHWGVSADMHDEKNDRILRHKEIANCKAQSLGPFFVAVLGQRYGERPLPATISAADYEAVRTALRKHPNRETRDAALLDVWYKKDENCVPPAYKLQNLPKINEEQNNNQEGDTWCTIEKALKRLLNKGFDYCILEGFLEEKSRAPYFSSDLDTEMKIGIWDAWDPASSCLIFQREIIDLKNYLDHPNISNFMEVKYNDIEERMEPDSECQALFTTLHNQYGAHALPTDNVHTFTVLWRHDEGVHPVYHKDYLDSFAESVHASLQDLIDRQAHTYETPCLPAVAEEVQKHWLTCRSRAQEFIGRSHHLEVIKSYIVSNSQTILVLHGEPGSGKTSIMSKAAAQVGDWVEGDLTTVVRFIGSTGSSFDVRQLLKYICMQLHEVNDQESRNIPNSFKELQTYFLELLDTFPESKNLVIFLDSLQMLVPQHNAHSLSWLPKRLRENVKIVVSTAYDQSGVLDRLRQDTVQDEQYFLEVGALSLDECTELLRTWLAAENRKLSEVQEHAVQGAFEVCALPLYVKLLTEDAKTWSSHTTVSPVMLPTHVKDYINSFFDRLELKHGQGLVAKALAYITASTTGLSDCEMEDLLSLDDEVLDDIYKQQQPSSRRVPPLLWLRLKADLGNFLMRRESEDMIVSFWYHRQFVEVTTQRYLADDVTRKGVHALLADYYLGAWHGRKKPVTRSSLSAPSSRKDSLIADRFVVSQPLTFPGNGSTIRYNKRKYEQVPRHLYMSGRLEELNHRVLFNYEWMYNKVKALTLDHVLADFILNPGVEATLVERALRDALPFINKDVNTMAPEISGRLLSYYHTHPLIKGLIQQCDTLGLKHCAFVPVVPYHKVPGSPLKHTLTCKGKPNQFALGSDDGRFIYAKQDDSIVLQKFDLATGERLTDITVTHGELHISPSGRYVVLVDNLREKAVKVHKTESGSFIGQLIPANHINVEEKPKAPWKLTDISVSDYFMCVLATTEESYLCVAAIDTCQILSVIDLRSRGRVCQITPDSSMVFCNTKESLVGFSLLEFDQVSQTELENRPSKLLFTNDSSHGYMVNETENKLYVLHLRQGGVDFIYKVNLSEYFKEDHIQDLMLSNNQSMLLVAGEHNLLIYNTITESVLSHIERPSDIPKEFKLPKAHPVTIVFTQAQFSPDDKFIIASIFRNVYIWQVDSGRLLTTLQAPVGIIKHLMIPKDRGQIITHLDNSSELHIWSLGDAISHVGSLDRLTASVRAIECTSDDQTAYVMCDSSDEVGVLDMHSGKLIDLLTHQNEVLNLCVSHSGRFILVATKPSRPNTANKIWSMDERKMLYEFGDVPAYAVAMTTEDKIICVYQQKQMFMAPYELMIFELNGTELVDYRWPQTIPYVLAPPFLTPEDKWLVVLTADGYDEKHASHTNPTICAISMQDGLSCTRFQLGQLVDDVVIRRILHVRPYSNNPYTVIAIFTTEPDCFTNGLKRQYDHCYGFLILDICSGILCQVIKDFLAPATPINQILFNGDASICLDHQSNMFDMSTGYFIKQIQEEDSQPRQLALDGKVALYYKGQDIYAVRLSDCSVLGSCDVHGDISCIKVCNDDRTVIIGCKDGSFLSYILIDEEPDNARKILKSVPSRRCESDSLSQSTRSWDREDLTGRRQPLSRPASAMTMIPSDKQLLRGVKPLPKLRPTSDTMLYVNSRSKTCVVM